MFEAVGFHSMRVGDFRVLYESYAPRWSSSHRLARLRAAATVRGWNNVDTWLRRCLLNLEAMAEEHGVKR